MNEFSSKKMVGTEKTALERTHMEAADWNNKWKEGKTGWHFDEPNQ